ncbi:MAG: polysaccharide biosynthesis protein [Prevotellaceae bacterium]|nr:polysaccharide biosynthesis protein [Prevotellaceae bacterium]
MKKRAKKKIFPANNLFSHLYTLKYVPRWIILFADTFLCVIAFILVDYFSKKYYLLYSLEPFPVTVAFEIRLAILLIIQVFFFYIFHIYSSILRHSSYTDLTKLLFAVFSTALTVLGVQVIYKLIFGGFCFIMGELWLYMVFAFLSLFLLRLLVKTLYDVVIIGSGKLSVAMVYSSESTGVGIAQMISSVPHSGYKLVGFISDDQPTARRALGLPILSTRNFEKLLKFITKKHVTAVIISQEQLNAISSTKSMDFFFSNHIRMVVISSMQDYQNETPPCPAKGKKLKKVQIEDLLQRSQIQINEDHVRNDLYQKNIMITGAAGSIGSELTRQICGYAPASIVLLDNAESALHDLRLELSERFPEQHCVIAIGDIRNANRVEFLMETHKPHIVFHAAAYKHVPLMEDSPTEAVSSNVLGTKILADMSVKYGVKRFVMISTDKAVNPTNVMGASKRAAEIYVQSLFRKMERDGSMSTRFITTRFGNVLGSNGSVIPLFQRQIEKGGPLTVTHPNIIRYFMTIKEACLLVLEAGTMGQGGEIFVFDMGNPVKIAELARQMIQLSGLTPGKDIDIVYTGLRNGEKLYEELLGNAEKTLPTYHNKVMIAKVTEYEYDTLLPEINTLIALSRMSKDYLVVAQLKKIVTEYVSQNSRFELLDINLPQNSELNKHDN